MQGFVTDHDKALEELFTETAEGSMKYNSCINMMATRIATVFASMKVLLFPCLCYLPCLYIFDVHLREVGRCDFSEQGKNMVVEGLCTASLSCKKAEHTGSVMGLVHNIRDI